MKPLKTVDLRLISSRIGFATNSSSSHSIVALKDSSHAHGHPEYDEFGWEWFLQKTYDEKLNYIYIAMNGEDCTDEELIRYLDINENDINRVRSLDDGYIDHDSVGLISDWSVAKTILKSDGIAILGGNDNSEPPSWASALLADECPTSELDMINVAYSRLTENVLMVRHVSGNEITIAEPHAITVFNSDTGYKRRYSTNNSEEVYLSSPELVDIKITDYCPYGCSYCYQNSTVDGVHADIKTLKDMVDTMANTAVFELAIGGGEPTLHPNFMEFIEYAYLGKNIVPNFTTRNLTFFKGDSHQTSKMLGMIGGFAYSVDNPTDVKRYGELLTYWIDKAENYYIESKIKVSDFNKSIETTHCQYFDIINALFDKVSFQIVLGSMDRVAYQTLIESISCTITDSVNRLTELNRQFRSAEKIMREQHINEKRSYRWYESYIASAKHPTIMLLGYKTTGRGTSPVYDYTDTAFDDAIKFNRVCNVGIDTSAARQLGKSLVEYNIDERTYYTKEGVASCYIDAVSKTMASSSYGIEVENGTMDSYRPETFLETFQQYQHKGMSAIPVKLV